MTQSTLHTITILQSHVKLGDPHTASDNKERLSLQAAVVEALVQLDETGNYAPLLAERWHVAADDCTWTFHLRPNVRFHDGALLHAEDVVASLARACDPNLGGELGTGGLYHRYLHAMTVTALNAQTVQLVTAEPMADLLDLLVEIPIVPRRALARMPEQFIGSGRYQLVDIDEEQVVMRAFANYWGQAARYGKIQWQAERSGERRVEQLLAGTVDLVSKVPPPLRAVVDGNGATTLHVAQDSVCVAFLCNIQEGVCADRRVRQALNYALDRAQIAATVTGGTAPLLNGPLTPLHLGYDPTILGYSYDPARAKALVAEAGYGDGLQLTLDIPTTLPDEALQLAELMADYYRAVGIETTLRSFADRSAYADMVKAKQIDDACCFDSSPLSTFRTLRESSTAASVAPGGRDMPIRG
ncbi:MAG: ABC transporter substrate-binding protein [Caldilineaceae bacterium]